MMYLFNRQTGLMIAALVLLLDAITKGWVLEHRFELPFSVVDGWLAMVLAWNRGMSFSLLNDAGHWGPWVLGGIAVAASAWFVHWLGESKHILHQLGLGLIIGGAVGNLLDRIQHGAVVDFILFYHGEWAFPAFNVADSAISVGVVVLLAHALWYNTPNNA
ncbi:MAG: signal peptidase II [Alphaproteobacteria bacterium]